MVGWGSHKLVSSKLQAQGPTHVTDKSVKLKAEETDKKSTSYYILERKEQRLIMFLKYLGFIKPRDPHP